MSGALQFVVGAGLIVGGIAMGGNVGLIIAGASMIASAALAVNARQEGVEQEVAGPMESLVIQYGRTRTEVLL